jgi:hypothetical protein
MSLSATLMLLMHVQQREFALTPGTGRGPSRYACVGYMKRTRFTFDTACTDP